MLCLAARMIRLGCLGQSVLRLRPRCARLFANMTQRLWNIKQPVCSQMRVEHKRPLRNALYQNWNVTRPCAAKCNPYGSICFASKTSFCLPFLIVLRRKRRFVYRFQFFRDDNTVSLYIFNVSASTAPFHLTFSMVCASTASFR